ncbi:hypothetical protein N825_12070 [Skermanella stibiiresistens SB22]|uniref:Uncharacterized protein n=1 Tax=Skermanella stibiiresistens SB22 TaxID=1385369 RepID=W9GXA4_9PROT|nr:hypothetical protein N825_12070 [Skermanella stibiiresistens SB22]
MGAVDVAVLVVVCAVWVVVVPLALTLWDQAHPPSPARAGPATEAARRRAVAAITVRIFGNSYDVTITPSELWPPVPCSRGAMFKGRLTVSLDGAARKMSMAGRPGDM